MGSNSTEKTWFYPGSLHHQQQRPPVSSSTPTVNRVSVPDAAGVLQGGAGPAIFSGTNSYNIGEEDDSRKGSRKRTRISKKAPTTLFKTDVHNFRAMVQQFTGPSAASFFHGNQGGASMSFGLEDEPDHHQMSPSALPLSDMNSQQKEPGTSAFSGDRRRPANSHGYWGLQ